MSQLRIRATTVSRKPFNARCGHERKRANASHKQTSRRVRGHVNQPIFLFAVRGLADLSRMIVKTRCGCSFTRKSLDVPAFTHLSLGISASTYSETQLKLCLAKLKYVRAVTGVTVRERDVPSPAQGERVREAYTALP